MKLAIPFLGRRKKPRRSSHGDLVQAWTTRDWADLPTHHPRRN